MRGHTHIAIGAASGAAVAGPLSYWPGWHATLVLIVVSAFAALLPDIDHPLSLAGRLVPRLVWPWVCNGRVYWLDRPRWTSRARHWGRLRPGGVIWHRGEFHSLGAAAAATVGAGCYAQALFPALTLAIAIGVLVGYLSHLAADFVNPTPLMFFFPLSRLHYRPGWLPAIREASWRGRLVEWALYPPAVVVLFVVLTRA